MKRFTLLTLLAALLILLIPAAPAAAQSANQDTGGDEEQLRTRAHHESWGPGQGLTLVGEVMSFDDESVVVKTTTGAENVVLVADTQMMAELEKGMKVAVDYNRNTQGVIIASQVRAATDKDKDTSNVTVSSTAQRDLYLVGTVTTFDDDSLVLKTAEGDRTFVLTPMTRRTFVYKVGDPVAVAYSRDASDEKKMTAREIRRPGETGNEEQERTRAHAESWGPGQGLTMVGEVMSWDGDSLRVSTTTGAENVVLTPDTKMMVTLEKGDRVAVDYVRSTQGAIIAQQVRDASQVDTGGSR